MKKNNRKVMIITIVILVIITIGYFVKDDALMLFNKQLDSETKKVMKEKLSFVQIKNIVFSSDDLTDFKEQISYDNFKYDNLNYYKYFNEISDTSNDMVVNKANQYQKEKISLDMIKEFNENKSNLRQFKKVLEKGVYNEKKAIMIINPEDNITIANKFRYISNYIPQELVNIDDIPKLDKDEYLLTQDSANALIQMCEGIEKDFSNECGGLVLTSAYRNYKTQKEIYNSMLASNSKNKTYVNSPGCSEHQLGNTLDIMASNVKQEDYYKTKQYQWIQVNAYKYGFIIRYPKNKESVTYINFEPWHLRYVGKDLAKKLYNENITLEEYYNDIYK
ncbi:D-alanyl-D-alanine carboxypeptidase [Bacilli bacterium PM5-3]|nr:D-alanyl-D-alanine carboxypeptidase [Bacilli bacterium PM5-3]MDH6603550.1 D-alanyl-D-alanine carboxypeptidase [Bacilli bacterium PM5-9]